MPHHSKQQALQHKQQQQGSSHPFPLHSHQSFSHSNSNDRIAHNNSFPSGGSGYRSSSSMENSDTNNNNDNTTTEADYQQQNQQHNNMYHRVPVSPADATLAKNKDDLGSRLEDQEDEGLDNRRDSPSREIAASVLLLAVGAARREKALLTQEEKKEDDGGNTDDSITAEHTTSSTCKTATTSSRPIKKRKKVEDIMRNSCCKENNNEEMVDSRAAKHNDPYHISPMSHTSKSSAVTTACSSTDQESTPNTPHSTNDANNNYKEEMVEKVVVQENNDNNKNSMMIQRFPSILHWILSESTSPDATTQISIVNSVLQWVPHGQAFRIIRLNALREYVIPKFFPEFLDSDFGPVDTFLSHLVAWGFEEIKDGPDIGAFAHSLFRRGHPQLCQEMKYIPDRDVHINRIQHDSRSILRVPSLSSTANEINRPSTTTNNSNRMSSNASSEMDDEPKVNPRINNMSDFGPADSPMRRIAGSCETSQGSWGASPSGSMVRNPHGPPVFVNYRPEDTNQASMDPSWQPNPTSWNRHGHPPTPPKGIHAQGMPPYSPIRIRSARGARRLSMSTAASIRSSTSNDSSCAAAATSPNMPPARTSFPVSNRGKGGRRNIGGPMSNRPQHHHQRETDDSVVMLNRDNPNDIQQQQQRPLLKRKLPLSSNGSTPV